MDDKVTEMRNLSSRTILCKGLEFFGLRQAAEFQPICTWKFCLDGEDTSKRNLEAQRLINLEIPVPIPSLKSSNVSLVNAWIRYHSYLTKCFC